MPYKNAQDQYNFPGNNRVDLVTTLPYDSVNGVLVSELTNGIDGITSLNGLTLMFYNNGNISVIEAGDFVIGTGKSVSIRYLLNLVFKTFNLDWKEFVVVNKKFIRARDINESRADISKIKFFLKWTPKFYVEDVVKKLILKEI